MSTKPNTPDLFKVHSGITPQLPEYYGKALAEAIKRTQRSCTNCILFDMHNDKDWCSKHNGKPPARVIVRGCDDFDWIPF